MISMKKHVALLRGINVGGHNKIRMVDLRSLCDSIGLPNARTYIQSGNIVLRSAFTSSEVASKLKSGILKSFGIDTNVLVIEAEKFVAISNAYPFDVKEHKEAHIMFLSAKPSQEAIDKLKSLNTGADKMKVTESAVYSYLPNGVAGADMNFRNIEGTLGVSGTARNRRTIEKLIKMINSPKN